MPAAAQLRDEVALPPASDEQPALHARRQLAHDRLPERRPDDGGYPVLLSIRTCRCHRYDPDLARTCLVTDTAYGHNDLGVLGILLDLGPQPLNVHVDQPGVRRVPVAPDLLEQHLPGEDLPGLAGQRDQQVELQRGEIEGLAVALDRMAGHVDDDVADLEHLRGGLVGPAEPGPDPGHQFLGLERLNDVVVGPGLQAQDHVDGVGLGRQHDDRHARFRADLTAYIDSVRAREHQVQQHQIRPGIPECLDRLIAVSYEGRLETLTAKHDTEHLGEGGVVIDDQHTSFHGPHRSM